MEEQTSTSKQTKALTKGFVRSLGKLLNSHLELFQIELEEARERFIAYCYFAVLAILCSFLFLVFFSFLVIVYFWDTYRLYAVIGFCCVYLLGGIVAFIRLKQLSAKQALFKETFEELKKDQEVLFNE